MSTPGFDARGAAITLKAAIGRGDVSVEGLYGGTPGGPRIGCPLHNGDSSNFEIYPDGRWRCHSHCGAGGDVFNFVAIRDLGAVAGAPLRGTVFVDAVRKTFEELGIDVEAFGCAKAHGAGSGRRKGKPYPPADEVSRLLAFAHELTVNGDTFSIADRARPGVGTNATAAGLDLCVVLGADTKSHRPKWATRWPAGKLFALYDERGALATVHLRPDDSSKGKGKNPARFNPAAFLMNEPMRALVRRESKDERNRARLLGYETARESAHSMGVLLTEGPPAWCTWTRWHAGPVGAITGQEPSADWMARIPRDVPVLLDFDPDIAGLGYCRAALRGLVHHVDVRVSARMRWILDRAKDAKRNPDAIAFALEVARKDDPRLLDPDELADGPRVESAGFEPLSDEERVELMEQGAAYGRKWVQDLRTNDDGKILPSEGNLLTALKLDERWVGVLGLNERSDQVEILRRPPVEDLHHGTFPREFRDEDASHIGAWYERELAIEFKNASIHRATSAIAALNSFDRLKDYLGRVASTWDGKSRLDEWLIDYLGAEDTALVRAIGAKWMIAAIARTFRPGCKVDYVLVLEGEQGIGKSSAFAALCPDPALFTDAIPDLQREKAVAEIVSSGVWICELPELDSTSRADISAVKAFMTRREERFRPAYGRNVRTMPRRVVFGASTNEGAYLRDHTGNRRFWPVRAGKVDVKGIEAQRDQLWAEAVHRFRAGEAWHIDDPKLLADVVCEQETRREIDPWEPPIVAYLETWRDMAEKAAAQGVPLRVSGLPGSCLEKLDITVAKTSVKESRRCNRILRSLGWQRVQRRDGDLGRRKWAWEPSVQWVSPGDRSDEPPDRVTEKPNDFNDVTSVTSVTSPRAHGGKDSALGGVAAARVPIGVGKSKIPGDSVTPGDSPETGNDFDDLDEWGAAKCANEEAARW